MSVIARKDLQVQRRVTLYALREGKNPLSDEDFRALVRGAAGGTTISPATIFSEHGVRCAYAIGRHRPKPTFLKPGTSLFDISHSLAVAVQAGGHLAVYVAGGSMREALLHGRYGRLTSSNVSRLLEDKIENGLQTFSTQNLSTAAGIVRQRTLAGEDIAGAISPVGNNRQIAGRVRVSKGAAAMSVHLGTGHVTEHGGAVDLKVFVEWAKEMIAQVERADGKAPAFLSRFAQRARFEELASQSISPTGLLLDLDWIRALTEEQGWEVLYDECVLRPKRVGQFIERASRTATLSTIVEGRRFELHPPSEFKLEKRLVPVLQQNKDSFSLAKGLVDRIAFRGPEAGERRSLAEMLRENHFLIVTMDDPRYAYVHGRLFVDQHFRAMVKTLGSIIRPIPELATVTDEKGEARKNATSFDANSIFRIVDDVIAKGDDALVCDDFGDEWADFVGVDSAPDAEVVSFYHAKHGKASLSASNLHEVVSQALKNVGRLVLTEDDIETKAPSWAKTWQKSGVARIRRGGDAAAFGELLRATSSRPRATKRICLVVSMLSKTQLDDLFERCKKDETLAAHEVQLLHILMTFSGGCAENGAQPNVYVRP